MKRAIIGLALLGLMACSTAVDTSGWPAPASLAASEIAIKALYNSTCAKHACTAGDAKTFKDGMAAVDAFIVGPYTEAFNTGMVTQALLDNVAALIAPVVKLISDIQGRKG